MSKQLLPLGDDSLNFFEHMTNPGHHVAGCEADDTKAVLVQPSCAACVMQRLSRLSVLFAINFNDQPNRQTAEIGEVWAEWKLSPKAVAMNRFAAKMVPELLLGC